MTHLIDSGSLAKNYDQRRRTAFLVRGVVLRFFVVLNSEKVATEHSAAVVVSPIIIDIDIKPGSDSNAINPNSMGVIPVAILTTDTFDAATIEPLSVEFGPDGATEADGQGRVEDVDGDGNNDVVLHFRTRETGIQCGDSEASLTGQTVDGTLFEGSDSVTTVGCE